MPGKFELLLRRKRRVEGGEGVRLLLADEIAVRRRVFAADAVEAAGPQLLAEEEGVVRAFGKTVVADAELPRVGEAALAVEGDVALEADGAEAERRRAFEREVEQLLAVALALQVRRDADRPHRQNRDVAPVVGADLRADEDVLPDDAPVLLHHEVELADERRIVAQAVQDVVFQRPRAVDVPERFADEVLDLAVVSWLFRSDVHDVASHLKPGQSFR